MTKSKRPMLFADCSQPFKDRIMDHIAQMDGKYRSMTHFILQACKGQMQRDNAIIIPKNHKNIPGPGEKNPGVMRQELSDENSRPTFNFIPLS